VSEVFNLLTQPLIRTSRPMTLPGVMAALARDEVDSFPALRPHQGPSWHMFLVQLGAFALRRSGLTELPEDENAWATVLRNLTSGFADDEPWHLVVDDWAKPAFLQPPVPDGVTLDGSVLTADGLDLLITSRNHDIKQAVARQGQPDDWLLALLSVQTGDGYGGARGGYQGIVRMNGGSSSRSMLTLAPLPKGTEKIMTPRLGARFRRNVKVLLATYEKEIEKYDFYSKNGVGLTWLAPWPNDDQFQLNELDIWFIEVCRRIRLRHSEAGLSAVKGMSTATRINAKHLKGVLGDPFAPVHINEQKSLTISSRDFDYSMMIELLLSGDWKIPLLALPADGDGETMALVAEAIGRGNNKTEGFKSRILPISSKFLQTLGVNRQKLNEIAQSLTKTITVFNKAIGESLSLAAAQGVRDNRNKSHYVYAREAQNQFNRAVDGIFFEHLWVRLDAQDEGSAAVDAAKLNFARTLYDLALTAFETALPGVPCAGMFRPRAESQARRAFIGYVRRHHPELFNPSTREGSVHVA